MDPRSSLIPVLSMAAAVLAAMPAAARGIVPPLPAASFARVAADGAAPQGRAGRSCRPPVQPMVDMSGLASFYAPGATQSQIDPKRMRTYVARTRANEAMRARLLELNRQWLRGSPLAARCMAGELAAWARADALLKRISKNTPVGRRQAVLLINWTATSIATAFDIADREGAWQGQERAAVIGWAQRLSDAIHAEFDPRFAGPNPPEEASNHGYWAGAALASLASVTGRRADLDWAVAQLRRGLASAEPSGALPRELRRGKRAVHYQNFALQPLALIVRAADRNGAGLTRQDSAAMLRIARYSIEVWRAPGPIERRTGQRQEIDVSMLAWVDMLLPWLARVSPADARAWSRLAAPGRPFAYPFMGVDVTAAAGPLPRG